MPGLGARSALGVVVETTEGTPPAPSLSMFIPMSGESNKANRPTTMSSSLTQDRMVQTVMNGVEDSGGGWDQPFDGASVGMGMFLWNGADGYSKSNTPGRIATITSATPSTASGTLPAGTYYYMIQALLLQSNNGDYVHMPASAEISAVLSATGKITLAFTVPVSLPEGFTFAGVIVMRGSATGQEKYLGKQVSGASSFVDDGSFTADLAVLPFTATTLVTHEMIGTVPATSVDPLSPFTVSVYKDNDESEQYVGNRMDGMSLAIGDKNQELTAKFTYKGIREESVANFTASYSILESFMGWQSVGYIDGVKDCTIQAVSLDCKNNVQILDGNCGVPYVRGTIAGRREISINLDRQFLDHTFFNKMLNGEEAAINIQAFGQPAVSGYSAYSLTKTKHGIRSVPFRHFLMIDLYRVRFKQAGGNVTGPEQIKEQIQCDCMKSLTYGTEMKITLINTIADYAA